MNAPKPMMSDPIPADVDNRDGLHPSVYRRIRFLLACGFEDDEILDEFDRTWHADGKPLSLRERRAIERFIPLVRSALPAGASSTSRPARPSRPGPGPVEPAAGAYSAAFIDQLFADPRWVELERWWRATKEATIANVARTAGRSEDTIRRRFKDKLRIVKWHDVAPLVALREEREEQARRR